MNHLKQISGGGMGGLGGFGRLDLLEELILLMLTVFFSETPVLDYADAQACDTEAYAEWCRALLARGIYPPPSQFEAWFPSLAHTPEHVERTVEAATAAFAEVA